MSKALERSERKKYDWLLDFEEVKVWITSYTSERTQTEYLRVFSDFCKLLDVNPSLLLKKTAEENETLLDKAVKKLIDQERINVIVKLKSTVNSFLRFHGKETEKIGIGERKDQYGRFKETSESERVYSWLLEYKDITRWINNYTSKNTRENYLRVMSKFLKKVELTPPELLKLDEGEILDLYEDVKQEYLKQKKSSVAHRIYVVLKTFFDARRKRIYFTKQDKVTVESKRTSKQHIPEKDEVYRLVDNVGSLRNKALILCLFQSAVRSNCIRRWKYKMVKDSLYPKDSKIKIPIPICITPDIDTKLKRDKIGYYYAFLQDEGVAALKTYIEHRINVEGWQPKDDDLIFVSSGHLSKKENTKGLSHGAINDIVKRGAKKIGLDPETVWAHLLRKSARKILYKGDISDDLCEAIMGHKLKGSKEYYFDHHDLKWIAEEYMKAPFSRESIGKVNHLEKEVKDKEERIGKLEHALRDLRETVDDLKGLGDKEPKKIKWEKVASYTEEEEEDEWKTLEDINAEKRDKEENNDTTNNGEVGELFEELKNNKKFKENGKKNAKS